MINKPIIYIIDDDPAVRSSMKWMLEALNYQVTAFKSAEDFLTKNTIYQTGCIFLDIHMPKLDGIEFLKIYNETEYQMPVVVLTGQGDISLAVKAMRYGANHFIEKPFSEKKLKYSIPELFSLDAENQKKRLAHETNLARIANLTTREYEILKLTLDEHTQTKIADILNISVKTVEAHKSRLMKKLYVKNYHQIHIRYKKYIK